jgi:iron(III) transport system ATP-binding protein
MAEILLRGVEKRFGDDLAVKPLSLEIAHGEFVTLLGPSGCGKTTTLRLLAGFLAPDAGEIRVAGRVLSSASGVVPPEQRQMGMVFQNYALWPHLTVFENVAFGLQMKRVERGEIERRVARVLAQVGLEGSERRTPNQMSGGQQQRVALARSLVTEPSILLLDEPLSNLDAKLRERMRVELKELQRRTGITFIYVTHDQAEAMALSDRIAVMHAGALQQYGPPREIYERPVNGFVADFMGAANLIVGTVVTPSSSPDVRGTVALAAGERIEALLSSDLASGARVTLMVRPEDVVLSRAPPEGQANVLVGTVASSLYLGSLLDYSVKIADLTLRVQTPRGQAYATGEKVYLSIDAQRCVCV